jgi:hypothetical protein
MGRVIQIEEGKKPENKKPYIVNRKKKREICLSLHHDVMIDHDTKMLECKICGYVMTPWEFIDKLTNKSDWTIDWINQLKVRKTELKNQIIDLERKERNAKARLKRAKSKLSKIEG